MAGNPLERLGEGLGKYAGKTKTSRSGREEAFLNYILYNSLIFLNYNLNVICRLLWEKSFTTALRKVQEN